MSKSFPGSRQATPTNKEEQQKKSKRNHFYTLLLCFILGSFLLYSNTLLNGYALDDVVVITQNAYTTQGIAGIKEIFLHDSIHGFQLKGGNETNISYYRPLSLITFALQYQWWRDTPWVFHLGNILIFALTVGIFFLWVQQLSLPKEIPWLATFIFLLHPIHTECVANIKGRDELLALFFFLFALWSASKARSNNRYKFLFQFSSIFSFFLALLSKENAVTFLFLYPLSLWIFAKQNIRSCLLSVLPYIGIFLFYFVLRLSIIGLDLEMDADSIINNRFFRSDFSQKYGTISIILLHYWRLLLFPYPLVWDYSYRAIPMRSLNEPLTLLSVLLHLGLLLLGTRLIWKRQAIGFGLIFIYASLSIVSGIFIDIGGFVGERFLYQGSLGFSLLLALLLYYAIQYFPLRLRFYAQLTILGLLSILTIPVTWARNAEWKNNETLLIGDAYKTQGSALVYRNAASALLTKALEDSTQKEKHWKEAEKFLQKAIAIVPDYFDAWIDYTRLYSARRELAQAKLALSKAQAIYPNHFYVQQNSEFLASLYLEAGYKAFQAQNHSLAISYLKEAVGLNSQNHHAWFGLGIVHARLGLFSQAVQYFEKATTLNPKAPEYWYNLGLAAQSANELTKAQNAFQKTLALQANFADAAARLKNLAK
ncbi:MAG: tetratricopeptide repeat protein [Bacteroidia bacterium]|nr:tetratricopeptide repeat protein [Bacteroidia bacterium]MDW8159761.1 tetratricopeptide repeat protein [Bacteroidia bacterium]